MMMKKSLSLTALALLFVMDVAPAMAEPGARGRDRHQPFLTRDRTTVQINGGVVRSDMRWNIAGNLQGTNPNILSELTWEDVTTFEAEAKVRHLEPASNRIFRGAIQLEGSVRGGMGLSGDVQDSDYFGDDRTLEFSRSTADANSGYTLGAQAAIGYRFNLAQRVKPQSYTFVTLAPLIGYGWEQEQFKLEGVQVSPPPVGPPPVLDSEYTASWHGPFIGLEGQWEHNRHMLTLRGELHDLSYFADATWNLRTDFQKDPSFEHETDSATGKKVALEYSYAPDSRYEFSVALSHAERTAEDGVDTTYFTNGNVGKTKLNEVEHSTQALRLGMTYGW
ncbi:MAG: hypothetical protein KKA05_01005 [Alphaproteobacteria bacterium]|nr:hypothetical protein [Alphaproteobacteria bacterium]